MNIDDLTLFFQWCFIVALVIYFITVAFSIAKPGFVYTVHEKLFRIPKEKVDLMIYAYLALLKVLFIIFIFVPYLALLLMS